MKDGAGPNRLLSFGEVNERIIANALIEYHE
jgi:hypothetical protein